MPIPLKVGFIGVGNMSQAIIKGLLESKQISASMIYGSNRSQGKLQKVCEQYKIHECKDNEELINSTDVIFLGMKPQDMSAAVDSLASVFTDKQIVISLAAGVTIKSLAKRLPQCRIARVMPNTPTVLRRGVIGYTLSHEDPGLESVVEDLLSPLGVVFRLEDEEQMAALTVSCASGTGFVFELMTYWQDWIEERGFDPEQARLMVVETFLGAAMLASHNSETTIEELQNKVTSKKGITAAGLESMRELELERVLRYSFEKAALRNQELAKES